MKHLKTGKAFKNLNIIWLKKLVLKRMLKITVD